ncbi:retrovirus-related pol polyprotein from transposon TNT 1-94 [Tanacetum coccineum]
MVTKFDIDKFDGKISFAIWKVHMQAVLTHHGYKKALRGLAHKPQGMSDEDWLELDEKALATIQLFLTREVLREVIHETTAAGLWLKLESLYMTKSLANKLQLKDRLYTFRMKPGTSVQDHLDEFNTILIDLENLDVDIDDEDKAVLLVISLPASYKHFKEIMLYGNRETLSFDDVKSALLSKQKYDDDVEPESGKGLLKNKLEREGKGNNDKKPEKSAEVAIAKVESNVYGSAGVATSKASLDDSKLWHYRLGHMGEKERGMLLTTFILIYEGHLPLRLEEGNRLGRSLDPNEIVGGEELGPNWCEVGVQVLIKRDEHLVVCEDDA